MFHSHPIFKSNNTNQTDCLNKQSREPSPTSSASQGMTEDSSTNSPTMHNPYMFYNSNRKEVYFSNLEAIPHATNTSLNMETVKERMEINIVKLKEKYPNQQANRLPNNQPPKHERLFNNIGPQFEGSNTPTSSNHTQPGILIDVDVQIARTSKTPQSPIPGILPMPTNIQSTHSTPSQTSSPNNTISELYIPQFNRFKHKTITEQQPQKTNQAKVNHSKKQMIKATPQEALRILQKHHYSVISQNQLANSINTKSSTRNKL